MGASREPGVWAEHGFTVDTSEWPLVIVRFPREPDAAGYRAVFGHYAELARRGESISWLIDMTAFNPVTAPASTRKEAAHVFERHRATLAAVTVCEARVIEGALARGVVTAFDWLTGNKWPCANFASVNEARVWIDVQRRRR